MFEYLGGGALFALAFLGGMAWLINRDLLMEAVSLIVVIGLFVKFCC